MDWGSFIQGLNRSGGTSALASWLENKLQPGLEKRKLEEMGYSMGQPKDWQANSPYFNLLTETDEQGNEWYKANLLEGAQFPMEMQLLQNRVTQSDIDTNNYNQLADLNLRGKQQNVKGQSLENKLREALMPNRIEQSGLETDILRNNAEYTPLFNQQRFDTNALNLDRGQYEFDEYTANRGYRDDMLNEDLEKATLVNQLMNLDLNYQDETLPSRIDQERLRTDSMRLGNQGQELSNDFLSDTYGDRVTQNQLQTEAMRMDNEQQSIYLNNYAKLLDNQVKSGQLSNEERQMKLNELMREIASAGNGKMGIVEYYTKNPKDFAIAVNQGIVTPDIVDAVNNAMDFNVFKLPQGEGMDFLTPSILYKLWQEENFNKNSFTGDYTDRKENYVPYQEWIRQFQGQPAGNTENNEIMQTSETMETNEPTTNNQTEQIASQIKEWIPEEEFTKDNVTEFLTSQQGMGLSEEEAGVVINQLFPEGNVQNRGSFFNIPLTDLNRPYNLENILGPPNTEWNETGQKLFNQPNYFTIDIPFLNDENQFTLW